jgi:hypothetical protein
MIRGEGFPSPRFFLQRAPTHHSGRRRVLFLTSGRALALSTLSAPSQMIAGIGEVSFEQSFR